MNDDDRLDLDAWAAPPPPPGLSDRVLAAIDGRPRVSAIEPAAPRGRWRWAALAAGLAVAAAAIAIVATRASERAAPTHGQMIAIGPTATQLAAGLDALAEPGAAFTWSTHDDAVRVEHTAGVVTYRLTGSRPLAIITPAGELVTERATVRVEVPMNRSVVIGSGAVIAGIVAIAVYQGSVSTPSSAQPSAARVVVGAGQQATLAIDPARPARDPRIPTVARTAVDRVQRDQIAAAIAAARRAPRPAGAARMPAPAGTVGTVGTAPVDDTPGVLTKDEIRSGVREVIPLLGECFDAELTKTPSLRRAEVKAHFTVDSEADIGTVVTVGDLAVDGALAQSQEFRDCVGATLESVVLPPIGDGGSIEVNYPFVFAAMDDDPTAPPTPPAPTPTPTPTTTAPRSDARTTAPASTTGPATAEQYVADASEAAMNAQYARALTLVEQGLAHGATGVPAQKLVNLGALSACRVKNTVKARMYYLRATESAKRTIHQACLQATGGTFDPGAQ